MDVKEDFEKLVEEVKKYFIIQLINSEEFSVIIETNNGSYVFIYDPENDDYLAIYRDAEYCWSDASTFIRQHMGEFTTIPELDKKINEFKERLILSISTSSNVIGVIMDEKQFEILYKNGQFERCYSLNDLYLYLRNHDKRRNTKGSN